MNAKTARTGKQYDKALLLKIFRDMLLIRRFEDKAGQMYGLKKIGGFCHLYSGQEAVAVGSIAALDLAKDYVVTAYRDHGHALACGMDPKGLMAELFGKKTGCSRGKGGSMHLFDAGKHMFGGNGIVGAQIPVATGVAFKIHYKKEKGVVLCFFGDGAIHQGSFHESMNLAKIWNLPVVFICENNQFGMGTRFNRVSSVEDLSLMGASYSIPGRQVDGMNVLSVYEEVSKAAKQAREKGLPSFLEIKTYRYKGHSMSDPATYRTRDEVEEYRKQDPILIMLDYLKDKRHLTDEGYKKMDQEMRKTCDEAVEFADRSEEPALESLYEDVLA
ncbi:MAG TPA: pyruvate dehydrogenase (acetyl-transferring) E1 component subunit alpha [Spirochaetia bacterium]|nr:pyruvate dehydrogenase (acetyl-transferring) E1 component subunit alpha [Spirochaetia bacterium]